MHLQVRLSAVPLMATLVTVVDKPGQMPDTVGLGHMALGVVSFICHTVIHYKRYDATGKGSANLSLCSTCFMGFEVTATQVALTHLAGEVSGDSLVSIARLAGTRTEACAFIDTWLELCGDGRWSGHG